MVGIGLGLVFASRCVGAVAKTISNLYILTSIEHPIVPWDQIVIVSVLGLATGWVGAWVPANQAANLPPLRALNLGLLIESSQRFHLSPLILCISSIGLAVLSGFLSVWLHVRVLSFE